MTTNSLSQTFNYKRLRREVFFRLLCRLITYSTVILLAILLYHIVHEGFKYLNLQFLNSFPSRRVHKAGIVAGLWGSLWVISLTAFFAIPVGVCSALFLEEYGIKGKVGKFIEINVANLAGVPSVVYGLLGLSLFVRSFAFDRSILSGSLTLSLLICPVIIVATREAIRAVPNSIRYGAYALGAAKWQVIFGHILPISIPGILTGVILALSRAMGETAPLIIMGALTYMNFIPTSIRDEFTVMPIQIYNWASRPQIEFHKLAASGIIVLLIVTLMMNFIAVMIRQKNTKRNME